MTVRYVFKNALCCVELTFTEPDLCHHDRGKIILNETSFAELTGWHSPRPAVVSVAQTKSCDVVSRLIEADVAIGEIPNLVDASAAPLNQVPHLEVLRCNSRCTALLFELRLRVELAAAVAALVHNLRVRSGGQDDVLDLAAHGAPLL